MLKGIKCIKNKNLPLHYIHLPEKSTDLEHLEERAAWTNKDSAFIENSRHVEVLSFTLNYFTPPHSFDVREEKKKKTPPPTSNLNGCLRCESVGLGPAETG